LLKRRSNTVKMLGKAYVDGELAAEAEMMAAIVNRNET
jgi:3-hydroxymyristoyl/3-hydroxydecanoyl-(acyl carrier protein) dehydratase